LRLGAVFSKVADWGVHVVSDGLLITGQNPASSGPAAKTLMAAVKLKATPAPPLGRRRDGLASSHIFRNPRVRFQHSRRSANERNALARI
jgi:hypothetical protein